MNLKLKLKSYINYYANRYAMEANFSKLHFLGYKG